MTHREHTLIGLFNRYGSDKAGHGYANPYSEYLPRTCRLMLELGVAKGASALAWRDFYGNDFLDLHILDLYLDPNHVSTKWVRNNGFVPIMADQSDLDALSRIHYKYEVIIDDASHRADHMIISFKHLFLSNLQESGIYFVEDCHTNRDPYYYGGYVEKYEDTPLAMFKQYKETGKIRNVYFNEGEAEIFESLIDFVEICADEKLIVIKRK